MTRKEVCKATGLSVKTLRLYEEKGLIVLNTQHRNGREYREYTPDVVQELTRIVTLRRALFTMEEIRTMQEHPEQIPAIFQDYQLWLFQQEQQFRRLRQAAERIDGPALSSIDGLLSELKSAAESMPLPETDIRPDFKRLDAMEESRLVERQVNFNETVPDARVFRQMNLVMDGDRSNNIHIAFGQYNRLRQEPDAPTTEGPVRRTMQVPLWYRILSGILTALVILGFVYVAGSFLFPNRYVGIVLSCTVALLAVRLALLGVPMWLEHRRWLRTAQRSDSARNGQDLSGYQREQRRKHKWILLAAGALVLILLIALLCRVLYAREHPDTDCQVCFVAPVPISDDDLRDMEEILAPLVGDVDGNGEEVVAADLIIAGQNLWISLGPDSYPLNQQLDQFVQDSSYPLYFITDLTYDGVNLCRDFKFKSYCQALPEDIADPASPYQAAISGAALFRNPDFREITVYACIPNSASQEKFDLAVSLLRKLT